MNFIFSCTKPYIPKERFSSIRSYKYKSSDSSISYKYFMSPLCDYLVNFFPTWLAPNVITISGFFLNLLYFLITGYYTGFKGGFIPPWACFTSAFCYLLYMILDNIDGKQARRTKSSSPLGLLVDHGTDACTTFFITCGLGAILALETIYQYILLWIMIIVPFYLNNWEEYVTGVMSLPIINGINEGTFVIVFLECLTGCIGQDYLNKKEYIILGKHILFNTFISSLACGAGIFFGIISIFKVRQLELNEKRINALIDVFPFIYFLAGFFCIIYLTESKISDSYPQLLIVSFGFQFAKMLGLLQLAHLMGIRYNPYNLVFILPNLCYIIHSIIYYFSKIDRILFFTIDELIIIFSIVNFLSWLHFVYFCSGEMCAILGIYRFKLIQKESEKKLIKEK
jgi:ethanolaminephosphotransferase